MMRILAALLASFVLLGGCLDGDGPARDGDEADSGPDKSHAAEPIDAPVDDPSGEVLDRIEAAVLRKLAEAA